MLESLGYKVQRLHEGKMNYFHDIVFSILMLTFL